MKSMWYNIRKDAGLTQTDIAEHFNISKQSVSYFETRKMPDYLQAYYLRLRGSVEDLLIAEFLDGGK